MRYGIVGGIAAVALGILAAPLAVHAQAQKVHRIGWLLSVPSTSEPSLQALAAFRQGLHDLGYVEGRNLAIAYRFADGGPAQLPALAAELVNGRMDVIVTDGSYATRAAQDATKTIPIVMAVSASPVEQGFVASLGRPGGNITGLSMLLPEMAKKRLDQLTKLLPKARRVAVLGRPEDPINMLQWRATEEAGRSLGLELQALEAGGPSPDYERAFDDAARGKADAVIVLADAIYARDRAQIVGLANKRRLPAMYFERLFPAAGGLMSYGPSITDLFLRSAGYVDKILKGAKPGDLPVQEPTKFDLVLNERTAKAIGTTFPPAFMLGADEVIR
jgi:putative tryptophan/tyrosine transport system substrate-binding protein